MVDRTEIKRRADIIDKFYERYPGESRALLIYINTKTGYKDWRDVLLNWIGDAVLIKKMQHALDAVDRDGFIDWFFDNY